MSLLIILVEHMNIVSNVDNAYMSTREIFTVYGVKNRKQLATDHNLAINRKSKRINGKVCKVYLVTPLVESVPENRLQTCLHSNRGIEQFAVKLSTALSLLYKDNLVRVNLAAFNNNYDVVIGDFNLVIAYNRTYTVEELRPIMDMHKDYEINYGQNATGEKIRFNSDGKLVSDLGHSYFYIASVNQANEDLFIYRLLIELANNQSDNEISLNKIGYMENAAKDIDLGYVYQSDDILTMWELVEYNYGEYLYPTLVTGSGLVVSNLLFNGKLTKEQAEISSNRNLDALMSMFGGTGKHTEQVEAEKSAIRDAVYKIYEVKTAKALAKKIAANPTKLAIVQAQIERQGNQQWRDVNKLLKALDLTAWVDINGMVSIGVYGDMVAQKLDNGMTAHQRQISWTEPQEQINVLQIESSTSK